MRLTEPLNPGEVTTHAAEIAYEKILEYCGASLKKDSVDIRIIHDVSTGTATYMNGGNGSKNGIIDTQDAVGGWPVLNSENAPTDTDEDGMPDDWENTNGLNPNDPSDAQLKTVDGVYPNIEVYINSLVISITENQNRDSISTAIRQIEIPENSLKVYFNNSEGKLVVNSNNVINEIFVYNITGQMLMNLNCNQQNVTMDAAWLKNGIYIIAVRDLNKKVYSKKAVKF